MSVVAADGHADAAAVLSFNNVGREEEGKSENVAWPSSVLCYSADDEH